MQTGFTFLVPAHLGCPGKEAVKQEFLQIVFAWTTEVDVLWSFDLRTTGYGYAFCTLVVYKKMLLVNVGTTEVAICPVMTVLQVVSAKL